MEKKQMTWNKKGFEMSWSVIGWIILSLIILIILLFIIKKGTAPGFTIFNSLSGN